MKFLFERFTKSRTKLVPSVPKGMRVYAFGDVHGRADLLALLLAEIRAEMDVPDRQWRHREIIGLGDYLDRGPASRQVLEMLMSISLRPEDRLTALKGNHEAAFLDAMDNPGAFAQWLGFGGATTLASYGVQPIPGVPTAARVARMHAELVRAAPLAHVAFIQSMPCSRTIGDYFFVHAGIRPGRSLECQDEGDLLWIRDEFLTSRRSHEKIVVHGHHIVEQPEIRTNRLGLDTGAYCSNVLTCLVLEGSDRRLLQATPSGIRKSVLPPR